MNEFKTLFDEATILQNLIKNLENEKIEFPEIKNTDGPFYLDTFKDMRRFNKRSDNEIQILSKKKKNPLSILEENKIIKNSAESFFFKDKECLCYFCPKDEHWSAVIINNDGSLGIETFMHNSRKEAILNLKFLIIMDKISK